MPGWAMRGLQGQAAGVGDSVILSLLLGCAQLVTHPSEHALSQLPPGEPWASEELAFPQDSAELFPFLHRQGGSQLSPGTFRGEGCRLGDRGTRD